MDAPAAEIILPGWSVLHDPPLVLVDYLKLIAFIGTRSLYLEST